MPYPLNTLPYGHRRRLRELAIPKDAYNLQVAAPDYIGIQPIQLVKHIHTLVLFVNPELKIRVSNDDQLKPFLFNNYLFVITHRLGLHNFSPENLPTFSIFHDARMLPEELQFQFSKISTSVIETAGKELEKPERVKSVTFVHCQFENDYDYANVICKSFKSLKSIIFNDSCPLQYNWLDAFLAAKYKGMDKVVFKECSIDVLLVKAEDFLEFFMDQSETFKMILDINVEEDRNLTVKKDMTESAVNDFFEPYFEETWCSVDNVRHIKVITHDKTDKRVFVVSQTGVDYNLARETGFRLNVE